MHDFTDMIDLASARLGGKTLESSDDFFAGMENLLQPGRGIFIADKYTENGKWMDGWESRRKRTTGHDWCLIKLGCPGTISGFDVDTNHFLGNYPEHVSIEACNLYGDPSADELKQAEWVELVPISPLAGGSQNLFPCSDGRYWTHLRLNIYPDGGVARFRVHGTVKPVVAPPTDGEPIDLAAVQNGGVALICNDMFFSHRNNLIMPGRAANMGDGWETRRRRAPGHDWLVLRLGAPGTISKVEVDTNHFKGNFPDSCSLEACAITGDLPAEFLTSRSIEWLTLLPQTKLKAHTQHAFASELLATGTITHVRLSIYPDGGVSRLRLFGHAAR
ncbi:MAG: allantoicase [Candidatus Sericytochromatia bacterium]|nr:allantoicase [Candidatus Sericytochromatia bacterium]